jgi:hypothetical protein
MPYQHTQRGGLHSILLLMAGVMLLGFSLVREDQTVAIMLLAITGIFLLCAAMFASLTIRDEGEYLALRYGPLPVFRKRIRYAEITSVEPGRTSIIDGWGIHYIPGRGWIYNLWGFDCVKLKLGGKTVRVGTDDVDNLVHFLRTKLITWVHGRFSV